MPSIALTATAAKRISFEFFAPNRDCSAKPEIYQYLAMTGAAALNR
jgi:hypothetical protein